MHNFRELEVWKKAVMLATTYYECSKTFPREEIFGLTSQSRRCVVSIASNIAEGAGRDSSKQFVQFLGIALGSAFEFETQIIIADRLDYLSDHEFNTLKEEITHVQNMLIRLIARLKESAT